MEQDQAGGKSWVSQGQPNLPRSSDHSHRPIESGIAAQNIASSAQGYADGFSGFTRNLQDDQVLPRPASVSSYGGSSSISPHLERGYTPSMLPSSLLPYLPSDLHPSVGGSSSESWPDLYDHIHLQTQAQSLDYGDHSTYLPNINHGYSRIGHADPLATTGPSDAMTRGASQPLVPLISPLIPEEAEGYAGGSPSLNLAGTPQSYAGILAPSPASAKSEARSYESVSVSQARGTRHLACDFCRGRKLKCIIDVPNERCRQCLRRGRTDCIIPTTNTEAEETAMPKSKRRRHAATEDARSGSRRSHLSSSSSSSSTSTFAHLAQEQDQLSAAHAAAREVPNGVQKELKRQQLLQQGSSLPTAASLTDVLLTPGTKRLGRPSEDFHSALQRHGVIGGLEPESVQHVGQVMKGQPPTGVASMNWPFHSNAVTSPGLGPRVVSWGGDWWDRCLSTFGPRPQSVRIVEGLLQQFVVKHATLMSFFHKETFLDAMRRPEKRRSLHPAVVFAALAAAVCDLKVPRREEPFTADITAADTSAQRLAHTLRRISNEYIDVALLNGNGADDRLAQAASTLLLTETTASGSQRLLNIVDNIVRGLESRLPACAFKDPQKADVPDPSHPDYFRVPEGQVTRDSEVSLELLLRICKTQISHFVRQVLAKPDEDITSNQLPMFISTLRPFYIWEPSSLSKEDLPDSFFRSVQFTRMSSLLAKTLARLIRLDAASFSVNDPASYGEVLALHKDLAILETGLRWLGGQQDQDAAAILPVQAQQIFVKIHVFIRVSLYRKTGIWHIVEDADGALPPSLVWWMSMFTQTIRDLRSDADSCFASIFFELKSSTAEIEAALRQVKVAVQILEVLSYPHEDIEQLLLESLDTLQMQVTLRPGCVTPDGVPLLNILDDVQGAFRAFSQRKTNLLLSSNGLVPAPS